MRKDIKALLEQNNFVYEMVLEKAIKERKMFKKVNKISEDFV